MKPVFYKGWYKGESIRIFPNLEIDNSYDAFYVSLVWLRWILTIGLETEYED